MHWCLTIAAGLACALASGTSHAAEVKERTTYFTVRGATLEELDKDLNRAGPLLSPTGIRHPGATEVKFDGHISYKPGDGECRVAGTDLSLHLVKTLPRWRAPKSATPDTIIVWKTLSDDIKRHEAQHASIAKAYVKKMESAIRNLGPRKDCEMMEKEVNNVTARYLADHERAQIEFDTMEGREMNMRLRRALKRNVENALSQ